MTLIDEAREWVAFSEEHPDEPWSGGDLSALRLGRFAVAVAEVLPELRREHGEGGIRNADCSTNSGGMCDCGADEHNATLGRLRAMLEAE